MIRIKQETVHQSYNIRSWKKIGSLYIANPDGLRLFSIFHKGYIKAKHSSMSLSTV